MRSGVLNTVASEKVVRGAGFKSSSSQELTNKLPIARPTTATLWAKCILKFIIIQI
jgi:hypothetical protein